LAELHERIERSERQLRQVNEKIVEILLQKLTPEHVAEVFDDFDRVWSSLTIREQAELIGLLVAKVEFDQSDCTISISLHASGIATLENQQPAEVT
jgi:site-specific DNA recombinase